MRIFKAADDMGNAESTKVSIAVRTEKVHYMAGDTVRDWCLVSGSGARCLL